MNRRRLLFIGLPLLLIVLLIVSVVALRSRPSSVALLPTATPAPPLPSAAPAASPTPLPPRPQIGYTPVPESTLAPVVVQRVPDRGEELPPDGAIQLTFDRSMDQAAVAGALSVSPGVKGAIDWPDARTVRFRPTSALARSSVFDVVLGQGAKAQDGAQLNGAYQFRFQTSGFLEVGQVIPAPGTQDALAGSAITVIFNRPVVALTTSTNEAQRPQPLRLEPAVSGTGKWLNTSIYVFKPDQPLQSGTTYTGHVDGKLVDTAGNPMQNEYTWQFAVSPPQVLAADPQDKADHVSVEPTLHVQFNQPIDLATAQSSFTLAASGATVPVKMSVAAENLYITPTQRLAFDTQYTAQIGAGVAGVSGGAGLGQTFVWSFTTVPLPRILGTTPVNSERNAPPYTDFAIQFNTAIDPASVMRNLQMTPPFTPTEVYTSFNDYDRTFRLNFAVRPSSDYAVTIGPNIADPYGNVTGQSLNVQFHTGSLPPSVQLVAPDTVGTYNAREPARIVLASVNATSAGLSLYKVTPRDLLGYRDWRSNPPNANNRLRQWTVKLDAPLDATVNTRIDLQENGGALEPGTYLLVLDGPSEQWNRYHLMVVSELNLTLKAGAKEALVWANRLADGQPASGVALTFYDANGTTLGTATTDNSGVTRVSFAAVKTSQLYAFTACDNGPPCPGFAAVGEGWSNGVNPGEFGLQPSYEYRELNAFVYTDRPIYRPGQEVEFKGVLRKERDARYSLPDGIGSINVKIMNPNGEQLYDQNVSLSQLGTFNDKLALGVGAALGEYRIEVQAAQFSFNFPFTVAAYRPPEFQVAVTTPSSELVRGAATNASVDVSYFFGGPVAGVPVQWNVLAQSERFKPQGLERYTFSSSNDPWICFDCWWQPQVPPTPILSGNGTTDAQGKLAITLPADLKDSNGNVISTTTRLIIEATATGRDNQVIANRSELLLHPGDVYVGLASRSYLATAAQEQQVDLVAADTQGKRRANQSLTVEVERLEWKNTFVADATGGGSWTSQEQRFPVTQQTLTTDAQGEAVLRFTPDKGGSYRVTARTTDSGGREVRSSIFQWVAGSDYIPWRRDNADRINLISDRTSYKPGETADILIPSPFTGPTWALVTVERGDILQHEVIQLQSNSLVYHLPLRAEHAPNVFVSVVLFTGPEAARRSADYKVGYLPLLVAPDPQSLEVTLTPDNATATPGSTVTYGVQVTDASGAGVATELSLDLVDKAVLSLLPREQDAIREALYAQRSLGIMTASGLSVSANRLLEQLEQQLKDQLRQQGGRGGAATEISVAGGAMPSAAATTAPAAAAAPAAGQVADRSAAANDAPPGVTLRTEFADTAFWQPTFTTDANGRGSVQIKLPDNLTTWTLRGVGLTGDTRVGDGTVDVVATKPLLVRPVTPRFLVVGDTVELAANVSNNTDAVLNTQVALATTGVTLTGAITQTVDVPAKGETKVMWNALVGDTQSAKLIFSAVSGQYSDAATPRLATGPEGTLPIYRYSVPETVGTGGQLTAGGSRTEVIALPPDLDASRGEVTVRLDPSLAAGVQDGLTYLEHYDYECTEQTVSRFLPNVLTYRALKSLGISKPDLEARLPDLVKQGVDKLALRQHQDGGWAWWDDPQQSVPSNPNISAYVVFGLQRAKEAGFAVNDDMLNKGIAYLQSQVKAVDVNTSAADANVQAFVLYVLGEVGHNGDTQSLVQYREKLSTYARALLAMMLHRANPNDGSIKTLLADLNTSAIMSATGAHWEESNNDWWSMNTDTRTTAIVLDALTQLDPNNQLAPNVVRWLMVARRDGIWETTQETAWSIVALTDWMAHTVELKGDYDYATWLNDAPRASGHVNQASIEQPIVERIAVADLLKDAGNRLTVGRGEGPGVLYYTAHLRAYLPVDKVQALDRGVMMRRRYTLANCEDGPQCPEVREVKVGDVIRVELTLIAPNDLYYLRVEDPLPAGAEAIDTGLATTSMLAQGSGLDRVSAPGVPLPIASRPWPFFSWYSRSELRDEKVALFADYLAKGTYEYSYTMRATQPGMFNVIPTTAGEFYFPEVYGRSDGQVLTVR